MLFRSQAFLDAGGFDEALYPNEENALMDELVRRGGKLIYDPCLAVERRPRPTLRAFCKMLLTYGRGRAEQFRLHPTLGSAPNLVPPAFCAYLAMIPLLHHWLNGFALAPLAVYVVALLLQCLASSLAFGPVRAACAAPLVALTHILYGLGFWRGLFTQPQKPKPQIAAEISIQRFTPAQPADGGQP